MPGRAVDVVVIGGGAAGLAAARRLGGHPLSVLVVEAGSRLGGRGHTAVRAGLPFVFGCAWLHSADRNPWARIAEGLGFTIDRTPPPWGRQAGDRGFSAAEQEAYRAAYAAFEDRIEAAATEREDRPAAALLEPGGRWNGLLDAVSTYVNGVELDRLSVHDHANYEDSGANWRVVEGLGATIAAHGAGLAAALDTQVTCIDHSGPRLRIETTRGDIEARAAVVTVPSAIIASQALRFSPALPDKVEAADALPLGLADKIFLGLDEPEALPEDEQLFGANDRAATGTYHLRPFGRPVIEGFFGGELARELERGGQDAFAAFAVGELASLLGSDVRRKLRPLVSTAWGADPLAGGSYSYALPGRAGMREVLAAPVNDRLFFAGEACSTRAYSTAHGAYETGLQAADQVLAALGSR